MTKISIIIPVYNIDQYLEESLKCILNQSFLDFEVILVNDGSTDNSGNICDKYCQNDKRVKVIHKVNEGSGPTRNKGIEEAQGEYIMFLDGDDFIEYNMIEKMYKEITENDVDLVICNWNQFGNDIPRSKANEILKEELVEGKEKCRENYMNLLRRGLIQCPWNKIYKTDILKENNIKFPSLRRAQDAVFNCRYFEHINSFKIITDTLYNYRVNDTIVAWMKFPRDYFEICIELNDVFLESITKWEVITNEDREYLSTHFVCDVMGCILYCFSPKWEMNYIEKIKYIKYIMSHPKTKKSIKLSSQESAFTKLLQKCIEKEAAFSAVILMRIKIFLIFHMKTTFRILKKIFN